MTQDFGSRVAFAAWQKTKFGQSYEIVKQGISADEAAKLTTPAPPPDHPNVRTYYRVPCWPVAEPV